MSEPVELLLKCLRLPTFIRHYQPLLDEQQDWAPVAYLTQLCGYELTERYQRRVRQWTREARLPAGKTFASLQLEHLAMPARQSVQHFMADLDWWQQAVNVILVGASGVGKTHIAAALGIFRRNLCSLGLRWL